LANVQEPLINGSKDFGERDLGAQSVPAKLEGGGKVRADVDAGGEKRLVVGSEEPAKLLNFFFALFNMSCSCSLALSRLRRAEVGKVTAVRHRQKSGARAGKPEL